MPCGLSPNQCRRDHVAGRLDDAEADGTDFEARCPKCGHGGFRVSQPTRSRYRNIWTCACRRCKCSASELRAALLNLDITPGCLGSYDGNAPKDINPEAARRQDLAIRDILAVPQIRPTDMRIILAEASGETIPEETNAFVKWIMARGAGRRQAYAAAERWGCRPSGGPPQTGGWVVDTSRNTEPGAVVKPSSSEARSRAETARNRGQGRAETAQDQIGSRAETARTTQDRRPAA